MDTQRLGFAFAFALHLLVAANHLHDAMPHSKHAPGAQRRQIGGYYRCARRSRRGGCDAQELPALAWEKAVLAGLSGVVGTSGTLLTSWAQERARNVQVSELLVESRADLLRRRDGARVQIERLVDLLTNGDLLADAARSRAQTLDREVRQAEEQIAILDARLSLARITEADLEVRVDGLRVGLSRVADQSPEDQRAVLLGLVAEVHLAVDCPLVLKIWPSPGGGTASHEVSPDCGVRTSGTMVGVQGFEGQARERKTSGITELYDSSPGT